MPYTPGHATRSRTFTYDQLNRITGALTTSTYATSPTHCWGETYSLDAWGGGWTTLTERPTWVADPLIFGRVRV
jgi:hypothetical protein